MILAAHQPSYLPYLGFFHKMAAADLFVWLDDVQYKKREFQNRNRIRSREGAQWLTVPVRSKGRSEQLTGQVELDPGPGWRRDHWEALRRGYAKAPGFARHAPFFEAFYAKAWDRLDPMCLEAARYLAAAFGIGTPLRRSSEFGVKESATRRLVGLCRAAGADAYLSGAGGKAYLEEGLFEQAGVALRWQEFRPPRYEQRFPGFVENLSAVDFLFNSEPEAAKAFFAGA